MILFKKFITTLPINKTTGEDINFFKQIFTQYFFLLPDHRMNELMRDFSFAEDVKTLASAIINIIVEPFAILIATLYVTYHSMITTYNSFGLADAIVTALITLASQSLTFMTALALDTIINAGILVASVVVMPLAALSSMVKGLNHLYKGISDKIRAANKKGSYSSPETPKQGKKAGSLTPDNKSGAEPGATPGATAGATPENVTQNNDSINTDTETETPNNTHRNG
jgi:hypothetical protein